MRCAVCLGWLMVVAILATGCGSPQATLTGKITLDNQPVVDGQIRLEGKEADAASIKDGAYEIKMPPGEYKVQINASIKTGERPAYAGDPNSPKIDITESIIPLKYNVNTELKVDLKAGPNQHDFNLVSDVPAEQ